MNNWNKLKARLMDLDRSLEKRQLKRKIKKKYNNKSIKSWL